MAWGMFEQFRPLFEQKPTPKRFPWQFHVLNIGLGCIPAVLACVYLKYKFENRSMEAAGSAAGGEQQVDHSKHASKK
jgi:hypothetical protein